MLSVMTPERVALARFMEDRKRWLRVSWREVAERGGTTEETLRRVRQGLVDTIIDASKSAIEAGLEWPFGTVESILANRNTIDLITAPRTRPAPDPAERVDSALRATYRRILAVRGQAVADQWLADTEELSREPRADTESDTA